MKFRALLSALLMAAGLVFVAGCESPEKGFKEWKTAIAKGDVAKAKARTVKALASEVESMVKSLSAEDKKIFEKAEVVSCTKEGDTATLKVKMDGRETTIRMVKEDGKWKVAK